MVNKKKDVTLQFEFSRAPYKLTSAAVADELATNTEFGLTEAEVKVRLDKYGHNKLDGSSGVSLLNVVAKQCANAMGLVLVLAMALSYGVNDYVEGGVITAVIILNIVIGIFQEYKAEKTIDSLRSLSSPTATVVRDGNLIHVPSLQVVPGDIVDVKTGDSIPADLRLFESMNFESDEALLTGESLPVLKDPDLTFPIDDTCGVGDRINLAYSSSTVTKGRARGIVIGTGMATEIGKIAASLAGKKRKTNRSLNARKYGAFQPVKGLSLRIYDAIGSFLGLTVGTPLQRKLAILAYALLIFACLLALIVFAVNSFDATHEVTIYAISLGIAIIPESLIAVLTITMAIGMRRMASRQVIVRKLDALEALGGVTNICSDKTGTLTQGKMITRQAYVPGAGLYTVLNTTSPNNPKSGKVICLEYSGGDLPQIPVSDKDISEKPNEETLPQRVPALEAFLQGAALCNLASVRFDEEKKSWQAIGDPTEIALQVFAARFDSGKKEYLAAGWTQLAEYPFDSDVKRMSVVFEGPARSQGLTGNREVIVFAKGAVERILDLCIGVGYGNHQEVITDKKKQQILEVVNNLASQGLRVLALARRVIANPKSSYLDIPRDIVEKDLVLIGLAGLYDPPRIETKGAVKQCMDAGIRVHMLTGDHPGTAEAIAREVGIIPSQMGMLPSRISDNLVMTATQFDDLSDEQVDELDTLPRVIARCAPQTKVRMIEAIHRRSGFAAMTGDGVNDSPSLKMADVGIAMGQEGSDVAKTASDLVLTDDNFASIVSAVEEGRRMFDNIQKFVLHLLSANVAEVILLVIGLAFKDDDGLSVFPLAPLQILWINMITSPGPAFGLSLEPASDDIMERPPHDTKKGVFPWEIILDTMIYGFLMGACLLMSFTIIVYGHGDGNLGYECNSNYNDSCHLVFKARAAMFSQLTWLILISAWEFKSIRRSMFRLSKSSEHKFPFFRDMYANKFLFYSVLLAAVSVFPVMYIPGLNDKVFKMKPITWEWSLLAAVMIIYVCGIELWKMMKRKMDWFTTKNPKLARKNTLAV
ncbi:hypothetical protein V1511DRAFT_495743 [Dipodascopsis uninucleata]